MLDYAGLCWTMLDIPLLCFCRSDMFDIGRALGAAVRWKGEGMQGPKQSSMYTYMYV